VYSSIITINEDRPIPSDTITRVPSFSELLFIIWKHPPTRPLAHEIVENNEFLIADFSRQFQNRFLRLLSRLLQG
jgi:hypothetical protein